MKVEDICISLEVRMLVLTKMSQDSIISGCADYVLDDFLNRSREKVLYIICFYVVVLKVGLGFRLGLGLMFRRVKDTCDT